MTEKESKNQSKKRVILELSEDDFSLLESCRDSESRPAALRRALRLYAWLEEQLREGNEIYMGRSKEDDLTTIKIF